MISWFSLDSNKGYLLSHVRTCRTLHCSHVFAFGIVCACCIVFFYFLKRFMMLPLLASVLVPAVFFYDNAYPDKNNKKKNPNPPKIAKFFCPAVHEFVPKPYP